MSQRVLAGAMFILVVSLLIFSTVQFFRGNLPAAMSTFPIIVILYLLVLYGKRK